MIVSAWNNGAHHASGAGYGLDIGRENRDHLLDRAMHSLILELEGWPAPITVNVAKESFWKSCPHLIHKDIGRWLIERTLAPWPKGQRPKFTLVHLGASRFAVELPKQGTARSTQMRTRAGGEADSKT